MQFDIIKILQYLQHMYSHLGVPHIDTMNKVIEKSIGLNVRTIRIAKKLSQEELSARLQTRWCDITRSALAKIEVGQRHLYPDEILQLKEILEVSFDDIFYGPNR